VIIVEITDSSTCDDFTPTDVTEIPSKSTSIRNWRRWIWLGITTAEFCTRTDDDREGNRGVGRVNDASRWMESPKGGDRDCIDEGCLFRGTVIDMKDIGEE
jgi:hypothetical protein